MSLPVDIADRPLACIAPFYDACRGLAGIGAGMMLPAAVGLLATAYPPGRTGIWSSGYLVSLTFLCRHI